MNEILDRLVEINIRITRLSKKIDDLQTSVNILLPKPTPKVGGV